MTYSIIWIHLRDWDDLELNYFCRTVSALTIGHKAIRYKHKVFPWVWQDVVRTWMLILVYRLLMNSFLLLTPFRCKSLPRRMLLFLTIDEKGNRQSDDRLRCWMRALISLCFMETASSAYYAPLGTRYLHASQSLCPFYIPVLKQPVLAQSV